MSIKVITSENFDEVVLKSEKTILIDFWASWCGPCKMLSPTIDEIATEKEGEIVVGKVNVDDESSIAAKFGIMSIPTVIIIKNGQVTNKSVGLKSKKAILELL